MPPLRPADDAIPARDEGCHDDEAQAEAIAASCSTPQDGPVSLTPRTAPRSRVTARATTRPLAAVMRYRARHEVPFKDWRPRMPDARIL